MKNAEARWPKESTMEKLEEMRFSTCGAVLRYDEQVLVVGREFRGFHAAVYEMVETPEETGFADIECRLNLVEVATELCARHLFHRLRTPLECDTADGHQYVYAG